MGIPLLTPKILRDEHTMTILIWKSISVLKRTNTEFKSFTNLLNFHQIKMNNNSIKELIQAFYR